MKINNLQILRFIAAFMVLFSHVQHQALKFAPPDYSEFSPVYWAGGVDIFFVISGFIMYFIAHDMFGKPGAAKDFLIRRLLRIAPPYWLFTTLMVIATFLFAHNISHPDVSVDIILCSYFFFPCVNNYGKFYPVLMLGWTLNFEFFFYILFAFGLFLPKKSGIALIISVLLLFSAAAFWLQTDVGALSFYSNPIILEFLFGIILAECYQKKLLFHISVRITFVIVAIFSMIIFAALGISSHYWLYRFLWMGIPALLLCAGFILNVPKNAEHSSKIGKFFGFLGDSSYSLYLSHPFSLNIIAILFSRFAVGNVIAYVLLSMFFSMFVSCFIYKFVERPLTNFLNKQLYKEG